MIPEQTRCSDRYLPLLQLVWVILVSSVSGGSLHAQTVDLAQVPTDIPPSTSQDISHKGRFLTFNCETDGEMGRWGYGETGIRGDGDTGRRGDGEINFQWKNQLFPPHPLSHSPSLEAECKKPTLVSQDILPLPTSDSSEPETPPLLPQPEDLLQPSTPTPTQPEGQPTRVPDTIFIERFEFVGSTVFSPEQLAEVTESFTQRPISFAELLQARSAVTQLYVDEGYVNSGAYIPPQKIEDGVVTIEIVEGGLETINVEGTGRLKPNYVRDRIALATSKPLNVLRLVEALQLLQLNPLIERISAELSAGSRPGTSVLDVEVQLAKSFSVETILDNGRSPSVGSFRRIVQLNEANLLGYGDGLSGIYRNTNGSDDFDFTYTLPLNPRNGTLRLGYRTTSSDVIEPPFDVVDIESEYRKYELTLRQPVIQTPSQELALGLTAERQESETSLLDIPFPLSPGADDEGRLRIYTLRFFQEWTQRSERDVIAVRSQFSFGINAFNATINDEPPDSRYLAWRGQAQWVRLLAPDTLILARADMQLADRALVQIEQFALGGLGSIRGYRQDVLLTDNGIFASVELRLPIFRAPRQEMVLQVVPFVDFGTASNNSGRPDPEPNTLTSIGLGLRYQWGDRFTAHLDWGIPLVDVESRDRTLQENGLYFSIIFNPF
ncbi:MAG: ShlB/FhaC/HecB family hemolysin secretion/activation protein [Xenococcaceae cyanobacterium]